MNIGFDQIKERLEDPFFELQTLGKDTIRHRTLPVEKYGDAQDNFLFIEWTPEDDHCLIEYSYKDTKIGKLLIANTHRGICFVGFACKSKTYIEQDFVRRFTNHPVEERISEFQKLALEYCNGNHELQIPLHLKGTRFQLEIWKQLVRIPSGSLSTYGSLAPNAGGAQAIGMAVSENPVSYIIPCHRIVKSDGRFEGYHWGTDIKRYLLAYELQSPY